MKFGTKKNDKYSKGMFHSFRMTEKNKEYFRRIPRSAVDVLDVFMNIKCMMKNLHLTAEQAMEALEVSKNQCAAPFRCLLIPIHQDSGPNPVGKGLSCKPYPSHRPAMNHSGLQ